VVAVKSGLPRRWSAISSAACGPNAIPTATARLSSTTGERVSWASPS
jgi:hypothetical protein